MKKREILEWTEIDGKPVPKRTRITYIDEEIPELSVKSKKSYELAEKIFSDENLTALQMDLQRE